MALGRTFCGVIGHKVDLYRILALCSALTVVCYFAASIARVPFVSLLACGMVGVGLSITWPGFLSLATKKYSGGGASMFALLAFGGDVGCSLGPFLTGCVSEIADDAQYSIRAGILAGIIFPLTMTLGIVLLLRNKK